MGTCARFMNAQDPEGECEAFGFFDPRHRSRSHHDSNTGDRLRWLFARVKIWTRGIIFNLTTMVEAHLTCDISHDARLHNHNSGGDSLWLCRVALPRFLDSSHCWMLYFSLVRATQLNIRAANILCHCISVHDLAVCRYYGINWSITCRGF